MLRRVTNACPGFIRTQEQVNFAVVRISSSYIAKQVDSCQTKATWEISITLLTGGEPSAALERLRGAWGFPPFSHTNVSSQPRAGVFRTAARQQAERVGI